MRFARLALTLALLPGIAAAQTILFRDVRLFDGTNATDHRDVLVVAGTIRRIGSRLAAPAGATVVDGQNRTLLPGLIDAHTHSQGAALITALAFGVTTELEMSGDPAVARARRAEQAAGKATGRADLYSAGTLATVPHGHGTEYGLPIPTIASPDSAASFVDARIAEGSDYIKLIHDDGRAYGVPFPTLSRETMAAIIAAAHARGRMALVHIGTLDGARAAIESGADGLAHLFVDQPPDETFAALVASRHAFVVPTLTVLKSITGVGGAAPLAADPRFTAYLTPQELAIMKQGFPRRPAQPPLDYAGAERAVRELRVRGVPILAGTDAGNPGTAHGAALHRELELLVQAGLSPREALAAATSVPARVFGLADRGAIAPGRRADLLLVDGDPLTDITATRDIVGVWKQGVAFDRGAVRAAVAAQVAEASRAPAGSESGVVSDFDDGTLSSKFGAGWTVSNDAMAGGQSSAEMRVVDGGAEGSAKSLAISGTIAGAFSQPWAGAMFSPGAQTFRPANLSSRREIRFWARGDGGTFRIMLFAESKGFAPLTQTFVAGAEWKEYVFPLSAFSGIDGSDLMAVIFAGGPAPGRFSFQVDHVTFR